MKNKSKELFVALAMETRLRFSEEHVALWGELQGYPVVVYVPNENYPNMFQAVFGGTLHGGTMDKQDTKELRKSVKGITRVEATATSVSVVFRASNAGTAASILNTMANGLRQKGFTLLSSLSAALDMLLL